MNASALQRAGRRGAAALLALFLLFTSCFALFPFAAHAEEEEEEESRRQKIVTVVYDNSASMGSYAKTVINEENPQDKKEVSLDDITGVKDYYAKGEAALYAHYAIQMLMGLLNPRDELYITPMNIDAGTAVNRDNIVNGSDPSKNVIFQVPLQENEGSGFSRNDALLDAMNKNWHTPVGNTPLSSVDAVAYYMEQYLGMQERDSSEEDNNKEYWLLVMTDGKFQNVTGQETYPTGLFETIVSDYKNVHLIYLGMGEQAIDLTKGGPNSTDALNAAENFHPYHAPKAKELAAAMTKIANELTDRYTYDAEKTDEGGTVITNYTVEGNTLKVTLPANYATRKVSVLIQGVSATVESVSYRDKNGQAGECSMSQVCNIESISKDDSLKNGFSAVINAGTVFRGGELVFTLKNNEKPNAEGEKDPIKASHVSILMEPDLVLVPIFEYKQADGSFARKPENVGTDANYINDNLRPGTTVRVTYEIHEDGNPDGEPIPAELVFGEGCVLETLKYGGEQKTVGEPFALKLGTHQLALSVGDKYRTHTLTEIIDLKVENDPTDFRIESTVTASPTDPSRVTVEYRVFFDDVQLTLDELKAHEAYIAGKYKKLKAFSLSSRTLETVPSYTLKEKSGSDAVVECTLSLAEYGRFDLALKVVRENGDDREAAATVNYYPTDLVLTPVGSTSLSLTANKLVGNADGFTFDLSSDVGGVSKPLAFDNPVIKYAVTCNDENVILTTGHRGSTLTVVPSAEETKMDPFWQSKRDLTVTVTVWVPDMEDVTPAIFEASLEVLPTQYTVSAETDSEGVNRFNLPGNQASVWFTVYRDGTPITDREKLEEILQSGEFRVDRASFALSPVSHRLTVEERNGAFAIRCQAVDGHPGPLTFFITSMFTPNGSIGFEASYRNADSARAELSVAPASAVEYVWRIVLIVIVLYLICLAISFTPRFTSYIPRGFAAKVTFTVTAANDINTNMGVSRSVENFGSLSKKMKCGLFPRRLIPFLRVQQHSRIGKLSYTAQESGVPMITIPKATAAPNIVYISEQANLKAQLNTLSPGFSRQSVIDKLNTVAMWAPDSEKQAILIAPNGETQGWDVGGAILYTKTEPDFNGNFTVTLYFFKKC